MSCLVVSRVRLRRYAWALIIAEKPRLELNTSKDAPYSARALWGRVDAEEWDYLRELGSSLRVQSEQGLLSSKVYWTSSA